MYNHLYELLHKSISTSMDNIVIVYLRRKKREMVYRVEVDEILINAERSDIYLYVFINPDTFTGYPVDTIFNIFLSP